GSARIYPHEIPGTIERRGQQTRGDETLSRNEFQRSVRVSIIKRATKSLQIDKSRTLTAEEGQVLCDPCNKVKTAQDVINIAKAKRIEARHLGDRDPRTAKIAQRPKVPRSSSKLDSIRVLGSALKRQGFIPAKEAAE